jgi:hypothetical protein
MTHAIAEKGDQVGYIFALRFWREIVFPQQALTHLVGEPAKVSEEN